MCQGFSGALRLAGYICLAPVVFNVGHAAAAPGAADALRSVETPHRDELQAPQAVLPSMPIQEGGGADGGLRIPVSRFAIEGVQDAQLPPPDVLAAFAGRDLSFTELQQAAIVLTRYYRQQGWMLAQAYLPPQDVENGVVRIVVLPGELDSIRVTPADDVRLDSDRVLNMLQPMAEPGQPLQADELERELLLLNDLHGVHAQASLAPGGRVGSSDLDVQIAGEPLLMGSVQLDNYGLQSTGEYRLGGELVASSPLGMGDRLAARVLTTEHDGLANGAVSYQVPINHQGTTLAAALSYLEYELGEEFRALDGFGRASVAELSLNHPLIRQRRHSLYLQGSYAHKRLTDVLDAVGSHSSKRIDLFTLGVSYERLDAWGGYNNLTLSYAQGHLDLLDPADRALDASPAGLSRAGRFARFNANLMRLQPLSSTLNLFLGVSGQHALDNLDSVEKFSLGGPYGLRAYPSGEAVGDHGWQAQAELQWQLKPWLMLGVFADAGWVEFDRSPSALNNGPYDRHLRSAGISARLGRGAGPHLNASLAWPGSDDSQSDPGQSQPRGFVALSYHF